MPGPLQLRVPVSEDTLTELQARADTIGQPLERTLEHLVKIASRTLPISSRVLSLGSEDLHALEAILGGGSVLNPQDLQQKVERLAGISFLHVRLPFTPNQLEALADKAQRQGLTVEQLVNRTAPRIYEQFFDLVLRS